MMAKKVLSYEERLKSHGKHVTDGRDQTSRKIIPLEDRVTAIRGRDPGKHVTDGRDQTSREIIPLEDRVTAIHGRDPDKYKKSSREIASLKGRKEPARKGWFLDPSPLVDMLISSAEMPLDQMFYGNELRKLESILWDPVRGDASPTYLDAVCFIADEWEGTRERMHLRDGFSSTGFNIYDLTDDAYFIWERLWAVLLDVAKHRMNPDGDRMGEDLDISFSFPAASMPLPQLYQAAYECCLDALLEKKMFRMDRKFEHLFLIIQGNCNEIHSLWSKQPVIDTTYLDLASSVYAATLAKNEKWIGEDARDEYLYDLLITPFVPVRDMSEQAETM